MEGTSHVYVNKTLILTKVCFCGISPEGVGAICHAASIGKDANKHERSTHAFKFLQMNYWKGGLERELFVPKLRNTGSVASLPPWKLLLSWRVFTGLSE
jgi:hypothetical protein